MYKWFKMSEFDSPDQPGSGELMEPAVVQALDIARDIYGFPMKVTSGFRSIAHNNPSEVAPSQATFSAGPWTSRYPIQSAGSSCWKPSSTLGSIV